MNWDAREEKNVIKTGAHESKHSLKQDWAYRSYVHFGSSCPSLRKRSFREALLSQERLAQGPGSQGPLHQVSSPDVTVSSLITRAHLP